MKLTKKLRWILIAALAVILPVAWYLISPIWNVVEVQEESPLAVKDRMESMSTAEKADFEAQTEAMKDQITVMEDTMPAQPKLLAQGQFKPRAHGVSGKVLLIETDSKKILRFEDFDTINGPNLHIYLGATLGDDDFIDLGRIKATKGNVNYELPKGIDTEKYNKVMVWCVPFGVLFSYAELS